MTKERLEKIKENVHARCGVANITGIGMTAPDREEVELIKEIERLNNIINESSDEILKEVREYIEKVEILAMVDKVNIFSMSTLKAILNKGSDKE